MCPQSLEQGGPGRGAAATQRDSPLDKGDLSQRSLRAGTNGLVGLVRTPAPWQHPVAWAVVLVTQGIPGEWEPARHSLSWEICWEARLERAQAWQPHAGFPGPALPGPPFLTPFLPPAVNAGPRAQVCAFLQPQISFLCPLIAAGPLKVRDEDRPFCPRPWAQWGLLPRCGRVGTPGAARPRADAPGASPLLSAQPTGHGERKGNLEAAAASTDVTRVGSRVSWSRPRPSALLPPPGDCRKHWARFQKRLSGPLPGDSLPDPARPGPNPAGAGTSPSPPSPKPSAPAPACPTSLRPELEGSTGLALALGEQVATESTLGQV